MVSVSGNSAVISVEAGAACARCAAGKGCGAGIFAPASQIRRLTLPVTEGLCLRAGDQVRLSWRPAHLLQAAVLVYGLPLAGMSLALAVAFWHKDSLSDRDAIVYSMLGLAAGLFACRRLLKRNNCIKNLTPVISERLERAELQGSRDAG